MKKDGRGLEPRHHFGIAKVEKVSAFIVHLGANGGDRNGTAYRLAVETPVQTLFVAPGNTGDDRETVFLPIAPEPVFSVVIVDLNSQRKVREQGKIRRTNTLEILKHWHVQLNACPDTEKLVVIQEEMNA